MSQHAIVTGAGSGVGRAVALRLAQQGWTVAALGRRLEPLHQTAALAAAGQIRAESCDVTDWPAVERLRDRLRAEWTSVDAVVAAAGVNTPRRRLHELTAEEFFRVVTINLAGAFHVVRAFLPLMEGRERATVVTVVSDAGMFANEKAGAAYVASKFGLAGLTESINLELRANGIRATAIFPGDINTPLLDQRATPPTPEARAAMLQPEDLADCVMLALTLPHRAVIEKLLIRPR